MIESFMVYGGLSTSFLSVYDRVYDRVVIQRAASREIGKSAWFITVVIIMLIV